MQRKDKTSYSAIGAMAGSSMDGLDLSHVLFTKTMGKWDYQLEKSETISYPSTLYDRLKESYQQPIIIQKKLDIDFGKWMGSCINNFKRELPSIDLLGVHGHTVIHEPHKKISWQLGNGKVIAESTGTVTVTDFRSEDVNNGGQGAPLVPYGDFTLFHEYDACLNLGGIANISLKKNNTAWDICPCNQVLNFFAEKLNQPFDKGGILAREGDLATSFYAKISEMDYFIQAPPKSLPNNFIGLDILNSAEPKDGLHTFSTILSELIQKDIGEPISEGSKLLITGGGAFNTYLVEQIAHRLDGWDVCVPDEDLISFKESLIFAFLGLKRVRNEINTLASVTGGCKNSSSGTIHFP